MLNTNDNYYNQEIIWLNNQILELEKQCDALREACVIFRTYGLPPHDVSGSAEWKRAVELVNGCLKKRDTSQQYVD